MFLLYRGTPRFDIFGSIVLKVLLACDENSYDDVMDVLHH